MCHSFQALESEIVSHVPMMSAVSDAAQHMITNKHYAASDVSSRLDLLQGENQKLKDQAAHRRAKLLDAVESQTVSREMYARGILYSVPLQEVSELLKKICFYGVFLTW